MTTGREVQPLVVGVDSSTQSTKVVLRRLETGELHWRGSAPHPPTTPPRSETDPEAWWAALGELLGRARAEANGPIVGIAVAAQQHGMVVLDADRRVIRPAKLWNDTESADDAGALTEALGAETWAQQTGSVPTAAFTIAKLRWLARAEPANHARVATVLLPHDWLTWRLAGELVTDRGDASGTGYFDPSANRWLDDVLALAELPPSVVPRLLGPEEPAGRWEEALVGPGTGDNMAAALGIALASGDVAISAGTSGTVFATAERPTADESGTVAGFADATGRFLPLACTLNAAKVTAAVARLLGTDLDGLAELALAAPPGSGGLTLVPFLDGERTPNLPHATGLLAGLRSDVTREQLARAAVEGVCCSLLEALDRFGPLGVPTEGRILFVGGAASSPAYQHVLAGLAGRPIGLPVVEEAVATGAAVQAAAVVLGASLIEVASTWRLGAGSEVEPDPVLATAAPEIRQRYRDELLRYFGQDLAR
jgi:xylulokinase